jgi:hypothetical protein
MRRTLLSAVLIVVAWFAGRAIYVAMASDETRIRWLFEHEAEAFHDANALAALSSFAPEYVDETLQVTRQMLRGGLLWLFQDRRDRESGRLLLRVQYPADFAVQVDGDRATATLPLVFYERSPTTDEESAIWELTVTAELERGEHGWQVARSQHETVRGGPPGR